jgi:hypothetical membrane protein
MTRFPHNAGVASGLTGGLTFLIVSGLSFGMVKVFPAKDGGHLGWSYLIFILLSTLVILAAVRKNSPRWAIFAAK